MYRRTLLAGLSATFGGLAGCNTPGTGSTNSTNSTGPESDSEFSGMSIPDLPSNDGVTWYHKADETTQAFVRPSTERAELPTQIEFTFLNRSQESTSCGGWDLYKLQEDQWFHIGPYAHDGICENLSAGESETWTIEAAADEIDTNHENHYPYLGGGHYAAVVGYGHTTSKSAALIKFDAPTISVEPTDDVTSETDGDTVTVTAEEWQTESDDGDRGIVTLERAQTADRRMIAEQVMQNRGYRNLLAHMSSDVEQVVLRTNKQTAGKFDAETRRFQYANQAYRVWRNERLC